MSFRDSMAQVLWAKQSKQCYYCGEIIDWRGDKAHIDHKQPSSRGGTDEPDNLCLTCTTCNLAKSSLTEDEFHDSLILRYKQSGASIIRDPFGKVSVRHPSFDPTAPAVKCIHGVYDPDDLSGAANYCSLCTSVCPSDYEGGKIAELKEKLAKGGLVDAVVAEIKNLLTKLKGKWRVAIDFWWNHCVD